jgi:LysM repeat protein
VPIKKPSNTAATKANKKVVKSEASTPKKVVLTSKGSENDIPTAYDSESQVIDANNLDASAPKALPKLNSCDAGSSNPSAVLSSMVRGTTIVEKGHTYHIVGAGETMTAISKIYNVNIMDLAEKNNKDCERIIIGEKLIIK